MTSALETWIAAESWRAAGASSIGTSHVADDKPCQDAHEIRVLPGGILLAAVSDGAGSAEHSEIGSALAVHAVLAAISQQLAGGAPTDDAGWAALLRGSFAVAAEALAREAAERSLPLRQLSATLIAAVLHPHRSIVASVGDGVAVAQEDGGSWLLPIPPARGEYANETTFLTSPGWADRLQIEFLPATPARLALFSDGLLRLALNLAASTPHAPFFDSVFAYLTNPPPTQSTLQALSEFLKSDRVNARTDDDKTLVIAWRDHTSGPE
jgi:hypothetical protein